MDAERFAIVKRILATLESLPDAERAGYLDSACTDDPALRAEIDALLGEDVPSIMRTGGLAARVAPLVGPEAAIGRHIGPFRLVEILGQGGMGIVYRAQQTSPIRRDVALKLVPSGFDTARVLARFESERQALALMNHPFIARALEAGAGDDGRPYFVMELVNGEPITDYCARVHPSLTARLKLFLQICDAVQHAHQRGVIHRDLKPSNVLLTTQGSEPVPKIIDFGVAKAIGEGDDRPFASTMDGQIVGTPEYMSPEQAGLIDSGVDTRSDVYALGVMLYEMITGTRPYALKTRSALELDRALRTPPVPPSRRASGGSRNWSRGDAVRDLDAVTLMALERMPDQRYASVEQLADDVRRVIEQRPVRARTQTWTYRSAKFVRRRGAAVATAALIALLVIAGAAGIVVQRNRALASEARALVAADQAKAEADKAAAVAQFLTDLFREADPARARGASVTARELLDRGAERLSTELASQDALRATLMDTIGVVYRALGMIGEAERLTQASLAIRQKALGPVHPDIAASLDNLGQLARERTRYEEAEARHREALEMRRRVLPAGHPAIADSLNNLALAIRERGRYDEARALAQEALAIRTSNLGPEHPDTLVSMNLLGDIESSSGNHAEAGRWYRDVLAARRRLLPPDHPRLATSVHNLGDSLARSGRLAEAEAMYREALAIRRKIFDPDHPDTMASLLNLASTIHDLGRLDEAEPLYREALAADRRMQGNMHMDVAIDLNNLASLLEDRGRLDEAETMYLESLSIRIALQGEQHPSIPTVLNNLGRLRFVRGALAEAERDLRRAIDLRHALGMSAHPRLVDSMIWLGRVLEARGQLADAEQQYAGALALQRNAASSDITRTAAALLALGHLMVRKGDAAGAEPRLREALAFRRQVLPAGHRAIADAEAALADCLLQLSRFTEAEELLVSAARALPRRPSPLLYDEARVAALLDEIRAEARR
jgi:tetratricopeptide (TPR) repeat protein